MKPSASFQPNPPLFCQVHGIGRPIQKPVLAHHNIIASMFTVFCLEIHILKITKDSNTLYKLYKLPLNVSFGVCSGGLDIRWWGELTLGKHRVVTQATPRYTRHQLGAIYHL